MSGKSLGQSIRRGGLVAANIMINVRGWHFAGNYCDQVAESTDLVAGLTT